MEVIFSRSISNEKSICISTLTRAQLRSCDALGRGDIGYYLYERVSSGDEEEIEILARIASDEAAEKLAVFLCGASSD